MPPPAGSAFLLSPEVHIVATAIRKNGVSCPPTPAPITATVLTKNSSRHLKSVLEALSWCDEVIVLDSGSTDQTLRIASRFQNVSVHVNQGEFPGFGVMHLKASSLARNDWILSVDSDEIVSSELAREIAELSLDSHTVYTVPFLNYFNGRLITTCGWYPDRHERLFNRSKTDFSSGSVHEKVRTKGLRVQALKSPIIHYSYGSLADFLAKSQAYSTLFAEQHAMKKTSGPAKAVLRAGWCFFKTYFLKRGIIQGYEGLVISAANAQTTFWKYLKLYEANKQLAR